MRPLVLILVVAGCAGDRTSTTKVLRPSRAGGVRLVEVRRFGVEDDSLAHGGAALASIAAIRESSDTCLYVLDAGFKKVAVFGPDARLRKLILGGHGEGPGEMMYPIALDVRDDGVVSVFDYRLNRVTMFSREGRLLGTVPVRRAKTILVEGDTVWGTRMPGREYLLWRHVIGMREFEDLLPLEKQDRAFAPSGSVAWLTRGRRGSLLVARNVPGIWMERRASGGFERKGQELLHEGRPRLIGDLPIPPGDVAGVGVLPSGRVGIAYLRRDFDRPTPGSARPYTPVYGIALFTATGVLLGTTSLGDQPVSAFTTSRVGEFLFLARRDPFPQVIQYRVELSQTLNASPTVYEVGSDGTVRSVLTGVSATSQLRAKVGNREDR